MSPHAPRAASATVGTSGYPPKYTTGDGSCQGGSFVMFSAKGRTYEILEGNEIPIPPNPPLSFPQGIEPRLLSNRGVV